MPKFKDADKIRMREDCYGGNAKKGEICTITVNSESGETWAETESMSFCNCRHLWELIEETKPEKTWDNLKVGDSIWDKDGTEYKIVDWGVNKNLFSVKNIYGNYMTEDREIMIKNGYTITPPQETITREEAEKILGKKIK